MAGAFSLSLSYGSVHSPARSFPVLCIAWGIARCNSLIWASHSRQSTQIPLVPLWDITVQLAHYAINIMTVELSIILPSVFRRIGVHLRWESHQEPACICGVMMAANRWTRYWLTTIVLLVRSTEGLREATLVDSQSHQASWRLGDEQTVC